MDTIEPKKFSLLLRICVSILLIGALFKIMHWPYSNTLMLISILGILILYPLRFIPIVEKSTMDYVKLALVVLWCFNYLITIFHLYQLPVFFNVMLLLLFGWWFINEGTSVLNFGNIKIKGVLKVVYIAFAIFAVACIFLGALFKIQHWPYSNLLFVIGVTSISILVTVDYFVRD
ncbi:hypothetical protein SAMN05443431_101444 [Olleya namhaensis]|uniref:Gliding motility protein GldL-like N-terminal domain-containing protein n=1 Tax=Olleya namhaensis TaxID=1144750 RepID=A0A1I3JLA7_9FLAO|nr:hypothetical protein SAMN05443431_101444 [Olleya namhaensis]